MSRQDASEHEPPGAVVRLTEDSIADLHRLQKRDPQIVRWAIKKMLLLERSAHAGEPLLGSLIGFRKLVVGDRDWRIVWRIVNDEVGGIVVEVAEVWAAGARSDSEIYKEMQARVDALGSSPKAIALTEVIESMGRLFANTAPTPEPAAPEPLPAWVVDPLIHQVGLTEDEVATMTPEEAMDRLKAYWSSPR